MISETVLDKGQTSRLLERQGGDEVNCRAEAVVNISLLSEIQLSLGPRFEPRPGLPRKSTSGGPSLRVKTG
ncbi:hypothetical protein COMA2_200048 [Candidatus Nitrospira nitrificans]|uniref:Uncharacterized protein n=1 Tax=Candidatus Nitrospira nitrificans TaxID=1742973 RepID=A0A0S4LHH0_9BACT|nr:hypothetical protein COMA2_200048 [Candidatus Nitrospira nitrificans]